MLWKPEAQLSKRKTEIETRHAAAANFGEKEEKKNHFELLTSFDKPEGFLTFILFFRLVFFPLDSMNWVHFTWPWMGPALFTRSEITCWVQAEGRVPGPYFLFVSLGNGMHQSVAPNVDSIARSGSDWHGLKKNPSPKCTDWKCSAEVLFLVCSHLTIIADEAYCFVNA